VKATISDLGGASTTVKSTVLVGYPGPTPEMHLYAKQGTISVTAASSSSAATVTITVTTDTGTAIRLSSLVMPNGRVQGSFIYADLRNTAWPVNLYLGQITIQSLVCTGKHSGYLYGTASSNIDDTVTYLITFAADHPWSASQPLPDTYRVMTDSGYDSGDLSQSFFHVVGC
jgi:hypothetical protein